MIRRDGHDGHPIAATRDGRWYRDTFGAPFFGLHRMALQRLLADARGPEHLFLECRVEALEEHDGGHARTLLAGAAFLDADVVVGADGVHSPLTRTG